MKSFKSEAQEIYMIVYVLLESFCLQMLHTYFACKYSCMFATCIYSYDVTRDVSSTAEALATISQAVVLWFALKWSCHEKVTECRSL